MVHYPHTPKRQVPVKTEKKPISYANRGMGFEAAINRSNDYYRQKGLAVIHKKPTPVQIVRVDYPSRNRAVIREAYFKQASTTDYCGVYRGHYIDFEAKETRQKTAFPLKNFHDHQIKHMSQVIAQSGICFVLLHFSSLGDTYLLPAKHLIDYYRHQKGIGSIPLADIQAAGYILSANTFVPIPYLDCISLLLEEL